MRFIVTEQDLLDNPILISKGFQVGDSCETTDFVVPTLKLTPTPTAQERADAKVEYTPKEVDPVSDIPEVPEVPNTPKPTTTKAKGTKTKKK